MGETLIVILAFAAIYIKQRKIMGALKNLQDNVTTLNATADAVVVALGNRGVPETDVQTQADAVNAINTKLQTALATPPAGS
jgi:hypothetical protein